MIKKNFLLISFIMIVLLAFNYDLIHYGIAQAVGQLNVIKGARPIAAVLEDPEFPDSLKANLRLVGDIKTFAFDSLGINFSENYSSVYDQKGKELMFVVTACEPFRLQSKEWSFPLVGSFSYKGFFDEDMAEQLEQDLKEEGLDTNIRTAGGWSTLGWFEDPILSNMLADEEADFAELLFHELTHGTLFVKDSLRFNENLASFIGIKGAERYLKSKYGPDNEVLLLYRKKWHDRNTLTEHILRGALYLDSIYNHMDENLPISTKRDIKQTSIDQIINSIDTLNLTFKEKYMEYYRSLNPNNTFFTAYLRYRGDNSALENELKNIYHGDIKKMLEDYKTKYPSL